MIIFIISILCIVGALILGVKSIRLIFTGHIDSDDIEEVRTWARGYYYITWAFILMGIPRILERLMS